MTNTKTTKRAFLSSIIALMLCFVMLLGTTFAWFTDTVSSGNNVIKSGILDVDMEHYDINEDKWVSLSENPEHPVFSETILWEPGYTSLAELKIVNKGNLALKYKLSVYAVGGDSAILGDVIDVYMYNGVDAINTDVRPDLNDENTWRKVGTLNELMADVDGAAYGVLLPEGSTQILPNEVVGSVTGTLALHMKESASNEYQNKNLGNVFLKLDATQYTYEEDSFDNQYDADAEFSAVPLKAGKELNALVKGDNANAVTKVVFGLNSQYASAVKGVEGVNADDLDAGTAKVYRVANTDDTVTVYVLADSTMYFNEDSADALSGLANVVMIDTDYTNFSHVKNARKLFSGNKKMTTVDLADWNTGNVTNMAAMFQYCESLVSLDLSGWNVSNLEDAQFMFNKCYDLEKINLSNWNTGKLKNMKCMFQACEMLSDFNVENWNTSSAENLGWLFWGCDSIKEIDLSKWDTSNVTLMNNVFCHAEGLEKVNVSTWNVEKVTDFSYFLQYTKVKEIDVSQWKTPSAINMTHMFANNGKLENLDLSNFDTRNVINIQWMFYGAHSLKTIFVGENWSTESLTNETINGVKGRDSSAGVFYETYVLTGGNGTTYASVNSKSTVSGVYAVVDTPETPGLLTLKNN